MDEINKNRHNKEQRAKYGTADIIGPVKEGGGAVNSLMGKADEKKTGAGGSRKRQRKIESAE